MTLIWTLALLPLLLLPCLESGTSIQADRRNENWAYDRSAVTQMLATSAVHHSGLPNVDEILFKAYPGWPPEDIVEEFLAGETDWLRGPSRSDLYNQVIDAGHQVSEMCSEAEFVFFPINCRDYKETNGNPNAPLNDSNWRLALSYVYGIDDKQADIYGYYKVPWEAALGNPIPPAQEPWFDASVVMPNTDNETAWSILSSAGYTVQNCSGQPWLHKNGVPVRPPDGPNNGKILLSYSDGLVYPLGPFGGMRRNWNGFLQDYLGANGPLMEIIPTDFTTLVTDLLAIRDFDVIGIGLTNMGRYVDWIYDCFHSDNDVPWGWNFCGIRDDDFDRWVEIILTGIDTEEVIEATENFTRKFVNEIMPWMPAITGSDFCTTARDARGELTNIVPMENYGPMNDWSYMAIHWKGETDNAWPGGSLTVALGDEPYTLNPLTETSGYGREILGRSIVGLTIVEPENLVNMPFVATDWEISYWASIPELGIVNGCQCTFWLRQDVTWHDNRSVTAYDCIENLRWWRQWHPPHRSDPWGLVYEEVDGPYKFNAYFAQPSLDRADFVAKRALLVPKHILDEVEGYWQTWKPSDNDYADLGLGPPPAEYPFLKQLVGCGPFVFDYYIWTQAEGRVEKYQDFFVNAPVIGSVTGEWRIDPSADYTYRPLVQNMAAMEADENGTFTSVTVDVKIFEEDLLAYEIDSLCLDSWNWTYLGPYTIENVACGLHNITVEVYDHTDQTQLHSYAHTFTATVREDVTTYTGDNVDFKIDMRDVGRAARAFGSYPEHPRWDPACDVNHDLKVDMRDIGAVARRFGWSC